MSILTNLNHLTSYKYERPISLGMQTIRLRPAPHTRSHIQSYSMNILPKEHFINWQQDPFGNWLAKVIFPEKVTEFSVEVNIVSETRVYNPFDFFLEESAQKFPFTYNDELKEELAPYLDVKEHGPLMKKFLKTANLDKQEMNDFLVNFNRHLSQSLDYTVRMEPGVQGCEETFEIGSGSCRDMSWLLCNLLRTLGFATRFASGYLVQLTPDVKGLDGPSGTEQDFTDLHAWTEVYLPGAGWIGLDATSGLLTGEGHIPLCCTPNPSSAAPISGTLEGCETEFDHAMSITRIREEARVTKPYNDDQWEKIEAIGAKIDADLDRGDVRLTMGGEPTFVSLDDKKSDEWHISALSDNKKRLGREMFLRLTKQFAPGAYLQYCQGKWYPGEILPRWAMNCHWRRDSKPMWADQKLLANPDESLKHDADTVKKFMDELSISLGIPSDYVLPAREDMPYYLWKEKQLPMEGEILKAELFEKKERERLQKLMTETLNNPVGYVLPLSYSYKHQQWVSNRWLFSSGHLILAVGDSPVGLRLPLAGLPFILTAQDEIFPERTSIEQVGELVTREELIGAAQNRKDHVKETPIFAEDPNGLIRSAICAEARGGVLHLFLPPISYIEHYLDLITMIEETAKKLDIPVVLEGYSPPRDLRTNTFSVTPDPGVIEVNIQPAQNWEELKHIVTTVYEEGRLSRLSTDKFMLDGRRVGTGGGNHIVMGSYTPEDSPFLRKPNLLRSMISFWQNHPSLSYLFASMYIGPTSQSPRIDEARHDSLYDLEIAFKELDRIQKMEQVQPWTVDRLFRNLLIDLSGNTHRAEFCIDKLYSPDSDRGRLGLLEMRAFEMTPHPQMNLLQSLLIRACVAHFWDTPYLGNLIRWGTRLHDEFMLPHYVWEDLRGVIDVLNTKGYGFNIDWFEPFFAFRFPYFGVAHVGNVSIELRFALEPWPVMGEEGSSTGTSRAVDSSVERLQVLVRGVTDPIRQVVTCNGRRVPLKETAEKGVYVAAVRFKAWSPASSLHPTIQAHPPLVFDLIDTIHERSLGGCTYYVAHPGGRNYDEDDIPVNDNAAEGRRLSRFQPMGHTPGHCPIPPTENNPTFPNTLDLRFGGW
ncbi:MAG: hypothetical protein ACJA0H_000905 [Francisellaceae bacterium]|jgi:uncharacterized protein (DUF2126 family)